MIMNKKKLSELKVLKTKLEKLIESKRRFLHQDNSSWNQYDQVCDEVIDQGFWFCFFSYDDWKGIKDTTFHQLRKDFLKAGTALQKYCTKNSTQFKSKQFVK